MKRYFLLFLSSVLIQTVCCAFDRNLPDGWIVDYHICGKDTVFYKYKSSGVVKFCGLKGYEEDLFSASTNKEYVDLIGTIFDTNAIIDLNRFLSGIEYCIGSFQENYNLSDSYQSPTINNFNYNWRKLFDIFGI